MSTRTTRRRATLDERIRRRDRDSVQPPFMKDHILAEYALLVRRVRELIRKSNARVLGSPYMSYLAGLNDVLALVKELKK